MDVGQGQLDVVNDLVDGLADDPVLLFLDPPAQAFKHALTEFADLLACGLSFCVPAFLVLESEHHEYVF
jgi:hypothetical protein